jgi:predicted RNA-binding Zn-ribbon protein involved in translation (DUF1610 family)
VEIRGERECRSCGRRWSYYDTGSVACPACGSLVSVGVDDRRRHTDAPVDLDLSPHRRTADEEGVLAALRAVPEDLRAYLARRGFVHAGDLRPLDDTYLAAAELRDAADALDRRGSLDDGETVYALALLRGADTGDRPAPDDVPGSLVPARALAYADAVLTYRSEAVGLLRGDDAAAPVRRVLGRVAERAKRVRALDGDVPVAEAEALVAAARDARAGLDDEAALARADDRLDALD